MNRYFSRFEVKIVDKIFKCKDIETLQTAVISVFDSEDKIEQIEKGFIDIETIYNKLDNNKSLIFENVYIENFSISTYKKSRNLPEEQQCKLYNVIFENSFFNCSPDNTTTIDFRNIEFIGDKTSFNNTIFAGGNLLDFTSSIFNGDAYFEYTLFHNMDVIFSKTKFTGNTITFKNAIFREGTKKFDESIFDCESVLFINTEFNAGDVYFNNTIFTDTIISFKVARFGEGRIDFNRADFGNQLTSFEKVNFGNGHVNFRATQFGNGNVEFIRCTFGNGDVSFITSHFGKGNTTFTGTEFGDGKVSFKHAEFGDGKVDFHYSHFGIGDLIFERSNFMNGNVDFRAVDFGTGKITFNRANFGSGEVIFEASELKSGKVTFRKTIFGAGVFNFEMANFTNSELIIDDVNFGQGKVSFKQSKFALLSLESSQMNNYFDLRVEECGKLDLSNTIVKDIIDINAADFKTQIKALDMSGIRLLGRIYIDWRRDNVKNLILQQDTTNANKAAQFRLLKENYNTIGEYDYEDKAYVEFKRAESKSILENSKNNKIISKIGAKINYFFQLLVFDKVGLYATDPIRVLFSMTVIYLGFSLIFIVLQLTTIDSSIVSALFQANDPRNLSIIQKSFYHSAITFLTIGYGDYYPSGINRWISAIEGFIGLFLMSYFTVAFVRKILR